MPSLFSGFEYDIFISYRHNDNLDNWVTDFVQNLEKELRSTLKDTVTIYFDKNPHDGLLETHDVDKSLEGKLKCIIFIPIISQTYCDTKSFAWQHEFVTFNRMAKEDQLGRDIRLSSGNVTSRILPLKIHELDVEDKTLFEREIGGVLRAIEFIYKEAGVNRPLKLNDSKTDNQNKTEYKNQVNKVANAVKEIISALKNPVDQAPRMAATEQPATKKTNGKSIFIAAAAVIVLVLISFFLYPKYFSTKHEVETLDKSIAVLPFVDISESKDQGWFGDGLTEEILNSLAHINGLNVISRTSSFAFKNKNLRIQTIADSLGVNYVVEGSVRKSDNGLRITAQLIRAKDGFHIWSNTYDRNSKDIFVLQQEIATKIAESLDISLDPRAIEQMQTAGTSNPEAFVAFLKGQVIYNEAHVKIKEMLPMLKRANLDFDNAIRLDPDFINPYLYKGDFYFHFLVKNEKIIYHDTITDVQAYRLMRESIEFAIKKSRNESAKDYYRLFSIMYSNDWSSIRPIVDRVLKSPDVVQLFSYQPYNLSAWLICLGYGEQIEGISRAILKKDPLNSSRKNDVSLAIEFSGNYTRAIENIDSMNTLNEDPRLNQRKLFNLYRLKRYDEAYSLIMKLDSTKVPSYNSMLAILYVKLGKSKEARQQMDWDDRSGYTLLGIEAAYGRAAANLEASKMDKKLALHNVLLFTYLHNPENLPFDLSAAPNFARRLRQAGVDVKQNQ